MLARLRRRTVWRRALAVLALVAVALKLMMPAGYMPGVSLAAPIMLCPEQGAMPAMAVAMAGHHHDHPSKAPDGGGGHSCAFAGIGAASLATPIEGPTPVCVAHAASFVASAFRAVAPGRGLAAPPPPSHAPPVHHA